MLVTVGATSGQDAKNHQGSCVKVRTKPDSLVTYSQTPLVDVALKLLEVPLLGKGGQIINCRTNPRLLIGGKSFEIFLSPRCNNQSPDYIVIHRLVPGLSLIHI